jgi:triosephosphate isomerase
MVAGNWKMHGTRASVAELINGLRHLALPSGVDVAVFPPCLHINQVIDGLKGKSIRSARRILRWNPCKVR